MSTAKVPQMKLLTWIYEQASLTSEFSLKVSDNLERQANTLLNILLVGAGGALAYVINLIGSRSSEWLLWGMIGSSSWLFLTAVILIYKCLWCNNLYGPANDPKNLLQAEANYRIDEVMRFELEHRQLAIEKNRQRNYKVSRWLNIVRAMAAFTPLLFGISAALVYL
ncbi:MAG TPA: hypothetical protein VFF75_03665 [Methylophilaceae bacterium]|nr:hypothetical protein [Methylophilaceae bacterium]